jgi:hypothetical protein
VSRKLGRSVPEDVPRMFRITDLPLPEPPDVSALEPLKEVANDTLGAATAASFTNVLSTLTPSPDDKILDAAYSETEVEAVRSGVLLPSITYQSPGNNVRWDARFKGQESIVEWCVANGRAIRWRTAQGRSMSHYIGTFDSPEAVEEWVKTTAQHHITLRGRIGSDGTT